MVQRKKALFLLSVIILSFSACKTSRHTSASPELPVLPVPGSSRYEEMIGARLKSPGLIKFIETWYGTPYQYAGKTMAGIDCSGFTSVLLKEVYQKSMSGSSASLYEQSVKIDRSKLQEGDMIFFRTGGSKGINHVGVYLANNYFVHASTSKGVIISNLTESYYAASYCCAGRWWW